MGIRNRPLHRDRLGNEYVERLIGTLRRDCLDHVLILGDWHLCRVLKSYALYYNECAHIKLARTLPSTGQHSDPAPLSAFQSPQGSITATCGYDSREGQ